MGHDAPCQEKKCVRQFGTGYHYVGGFYGACNEVLMRLELVKNGPIAVGFEVYNDFVNYKSGIYHHTGKEKDPLFLNGMHSTMFSLVEKSIYCSTVYLCLNFCKPFKANINYYVQYVLLHATSTDEMSGHSWLTNLSQSSPKCNNNSFFIANVDKS